MPAEVAETPAAEQESVEFGTPLEEIFAKAMPTDEEEPVKEDKKEPVKTEKEEKKEPEKVKIEKKPVEEKPDDLLSDILQGVQPEKKEEVKPSEEEEIKKEEPPKELKGKARESFERIANEKYELNKRLRTAQKELGEIKKKGTDIDVNTKARLETL